jgi:hypothetical protein
LCQHARFSVNSLEIADDEKRKGGGEKPEDVEQGFSRNDGREVEVGFSNAGWKDVAYTAPPGRSVFQSNPMDVVKGDKPGVKLVP